MLLTNLKRKFTYIFRGKHYYYKMSQLNLVAPSIKQTKPQAPSPFTDEEQYQFRANIRNILRKFMLPK